MGCKGQLQLVIILVVGNKLMIQVNAGELFKLGKPLLRTVFLI